MKEIKFAIATLVTLSFSSQAASENATPSLTIGLGAQYAPEYTGADKYNTNVLPYIEWSNDTWFLNSEKGAGYTRQFDNGIYIGQALGYSVGRTDKGNSWIQEGSKKLKGMGKIKPARTSTTTVGWWITP